MKAEIQQELFNYFADNHDLKLLDSDFNDIERIIDMEDFAKQEKEKEAIAFLKYDDRSDRNLRHWGMVEYKQYYQQYLIDKEDEK